MVNSANDLEGSLMMANHLRTFRAQLAMDIAIRTRAVGQRRVLRTTYFAVSQASKFELENDLFAVSVNRIHSKEASWHGCIGDRKCDRQSPDSFFPVQRSLNHIYSVSPPYYIHHLLISSTSSLLDKT